MVTAEYGGARVTQKIDIVAALCWSAAVVTVQPWSGGDDGLSLYKGVTLAALLFIALTRVPRLPMWVAWPGIGALALYVGASVVTSLLQPAFLSPLTRVGRLLLGCLLFLFLLLDGQRSRWTLLTGYLVGHAAIGLVTLLGAVVSPSLAFRTSFDDSLNGEGARLGGVFLPLTPPRVGEVGAVISGVAIFMLFHRVCSRRLCAPLALLGLGLVVGSRTRTAAVILALSLLVSFVATREVPGGRRGLYTAFGTLAASVPFIPLLLEWSMRGQDLRTLTTLTGRTVTWEYVLSEHVGVPQLMFGHGLGTKTILMRRSDGSFGLSAIDNGYLTLYWEAGLVGLLLILFVILRIWLTARTFSDPIFRGIAILLICYVTFASVAETGVGDFSSMTIHMLTAAGLVTRLRPCSSGADGGAAAAR